MNIDDLKPNSHRSKEEAPAPVQKEPIKKVVSGPVKTRSNGLTKFTDIFAPGDVQNIKSYIVMDVLVPAIKKAVSDIVTNGIDMILYGDSGSKNRKSTPASSVSYTRYYDSPKNDSRTSSYSQPRSRYSFEGAVISSRGEAEDVLSRMDELIGRFGAASVADLNDLMGIRGDYTDNKYGWTNLSSASVGRVYDGYILKMPRVMLLD